MTNRTIAPIITIPSTLKVKDEKKTTTANGVEIYSLDFHEYDVLRVSFVFRAGTKYQTKPFSASSVAGMLSEGCAKYSAREIAEMLDFYGMYFDNSTDRDYTVITLCTLKRFFAKGMELLGEMLSSPSFPEQEFNIYKNKKKQEIAIHRSKIDFVAREHFAKAIFGAKHHYGTSSHETEYDKLTREDLAELFSRLYTRENLFVVTSGNLCPESLNEIIRVADSMPSGVKSCFSPIPCTQTKDVFIAWDKAQQSVIRIGLPLFTRRHPDFTAMQVLVTALGGYFGSRLISNLREEKGYTYGIFAGLINMEDEGYLAVSTEVACSVTDAAVSEIYKEIDLLTRELMSTEELTMVKSVMMGEMLRVLDGPFGIADVTIENILTGRSNTFLHSQVSEIMSMTPEKVMLMAQKYFIRENFTTLIVGEKNNE